MSRLFASGLLFSLLSLQCCGTADLAKEGMTLPKRPPVSRAPLPRGANVWPGHRHLPIPGLLTRPAVLSGPPTPPDCHPLVQDSPLHGQVEISLLRSWRSVWALLHCHQCLLSFPFVFSRCVLFYLVLAVLGLHCCVGFFSRCSKQGLLSSCDAGFSLWRLLVAEHRLPGSRASVVVGSVVVAPGIWSTGSVVVAHRLRCSVTRGIFPDQGSNPRLRHWQADSSPLSYQESPHFLFCFPCNHPPAWFVGSQFPDQGLNLGPLQ